MQSLWSRAATTQSTCHCVSCLSTVSSGVTSRATTAASKRRLRIGNSVTALYTSIFAAAALADARAKDQRRHEWEEKIAAVKEEVNELANEERRLLTSITSRRRRRLFDGPLQARQYSTASSLATEHRRFARGIGSCRPYHSATSVAEEENEPKLLERVVEEMGSFTDDDPNGASALALELEENEPWQYSTDFLRMKAVRRLVMRQLAIRILLRPTVAHNYLGHRADYTANYKLPRMNASELLEELDMLRRKIRDIKHSKEEPIDDLTSDLRTRFIPSLMGEQNRLDSELQRDSDLYISGAMSLQEFLLRLASNLMQATDPDRPRAIRLMLMTFSKTRQNDLGDLVLRTILPHKFLLTSSTILTILSFLRKTKNLRDFDLFLHMLTGTGYEIDLGALHYYVRKEVNGVQIIVPPVDSANPVIYANLITAALRFGQIERADAWLQAARQTGFMDDFTTLYGYLKFCSARADWERGSSTLRRAVAYIVSSIAHDDHRVDRMIALMVLMCDSCGKLDVSDALISAAMKAGFPSNIAESQTDIVWSTDHHFKRWQNAADQLITGMENKPVWEKCHLFASLVGDLIATEEMSVSRRQREMEKWHSQHVLGTTLDDTLIKNTTDSAENAPTKKEDIAALRDEFARLKELVHQLRDTHIDENQPNQASNMRRRNAALRDEGTQLKELVHQLRCTNMNEDESSQVATQEPPIETRFDKETSKTWRLNVALRKKIAQRWELVQQLRGTNTDEYESTAQKPFIETSPPEDSSKRELRRQVKAMRVEAAQLRRLVDQLRGTNITQEPPIETTPPEESAKQARHRRRRIRQMEKKMGAMSQDPNQETTQETNLEKNLEKNLENDSQFKLSWEKT